MKPARLSSGEPYARGLVTQNPFVGKADVRGVIVAVLGLTFAERHMVLDPFRSRAVVSGGVYELVLTDELDCGPGGVVERAAYLGFLRIHDSGVVAVGDACYLGGGYVGSVVGFNSDHEPNHFNIVLAGHHLQSGAECGLSVGERVLFRFGAPDAHGQA